MQALQSIIKLAVPGTNNVNQLTDTKDYVVKVMKFFCERFGGATVSKTEGGYIASDGQLVVEPVSWVWSYCTTQQLEMHSAEVVSLAETLCRELHQESVAVIINESMFFVTIA